MLTVLILNLKGIDRVSTIQIWFEFFEESFRENSIAIIEISKENNADISLWFPKNYSSVNYIYVDLYPMLVRVVLMFGHVKKGAMFD